MDDRDASLTVKPRAGKAGHLPGPVAIHYHREHILHPVTTRTTASDLALVDVARGMRGMVAEARAEHNDCADNRNESRCPNTVRKKMGDTITDRLILL
jgi:hypothetical protein